MIQYKDGGNFSNVHAKGAIVITADANSSEADLLEYDGAFLLANIGITGDTLSSSVYLEVEVEHSDDNSTWVDCADADLSSTVTGTNTGTIAKIDDNAEDDVTVTAGYLGRKRYVRLVYNLTGTHSNGIEVAGDILRFRAKY